MCGRFSLLGTPEEIAAYLALMELEDFPPRFNIAPTQPILMVISGETPPPGSNRSDRKALLVRWGFIPGWVKRYCRLPIDDQCEVGNCNREGLFQDRYAPSPGSHSGIRFL